MNKYYFSKTNDSSQAANSKKAIIMNGSEVNFYKNGELRKTGSAPHSINLTRGRALFENLQNINYNRYSSFFTGVNTHAVYDTQNIANVNAFAYIRNNNIGNIDTKNRWPKQNEYNNN